MAHVSGTLTSTTLRSLKDGVVNVLYFNSEILKFQVELRLLEDNRYDCQLQVAAASRNLQEVPPDVVTWLSKADDILREGEHICNIKTARKYYFLDIYSRYNLARSAKRLLIEMKKLPDPDFECFTWLARSNMTDCSYENEVVKEVSFMDMVMKALKTEGPTSIIGLHGIVGDGEKVAAQVCERAKVEGRMFNKFVMVDASSSNRSMFKILCDLQEKLGLGLKFEEGKKSFKKIRGIVNKWLLQTWVLVVLYNVKEKFELGDVGIGHKYRCSKVVVISSELSICEEMGIQRIFQVPGVVQDSDEWDHFKKKAGDWIQKAGRDCLANEFIKEYCNGYPQAGRAEIGKLAEQINEWIKRVEISNGISVPDAHEVINRRRKNLFRVAARSLTLV